MNENIKFAVTGLGAKGCLVGFDDNIEHYPAIELDLPLIDTNGAGDCLAVGFSASYFLDGYSFEDSILRGQICARYCCSLKANSRDLISEEKLELLFQSMKSMTYL